MIALMPVFVTFGSKEELIPMARKRKKMTKTSAATLALAAGPEPEVKFEKGAERGFLMDAFNWYSGVSTPDEYQKWTVNYLTSKKYADDEVAAIKRLDGWRFATVGPYARMYDRGLDKKIGEVYFTNTLKGLIALGMAIKPVEKVESDTPKISVQDRIKAKAREIIGNIESEVDTFMDNDYNTGHSFYEWYQENDVKASYVPAIVDYYTPILEEIKEAQTDKDLKEGYSLTKKEFKSVIAFYKGIITDAQKLAKNAKKTRKTRKPRKKSVTVMVKKVKYAPDFKELQLQSIDPVKILAAKELWVYHTTKRIFAVYEAQDTGGLGIKGTTLTGVGQVRAKKLRKPADVLKSFEDAKGIRAARKVFDGVKAKEKNLTTRLNGAIVLVRVF